MKTKRIGWMRWMAMIAAMVGTVAAQQLGNGLAVVPVDRVKPEVPVFYTVDGDTTAAVSEGRAEVTMQLGAHLLQGRPETITVGLSGEGKVTEVTGPELVSWAVRTESDGSRFLDLKPRLPELPAWNFAAPTPLVDPAQDFSFTVKIVHEGDEFALALPGPGKAVGFTSMVSIQETEWFKARLLEVGGLSRIENDRFEGNGEAKLRMKIIPVGGETPDIELVDPVLVGRFEGDAMDFVLRGNVRVSEAGAALELFRGVALGPVTSGANWFVRVVKKGDDWVHELVGTGPGESGLELPFTADVSPQGDARKIGFALPAGTIVPVRIEGLGERVSFEADHALRPVWRDGAWQGFLNAEGRVEMAWKEGGSEADGTLFFSSNETTDIRVGAGLLRQTSELELRVLQGSLDQLDLELGGEGEVLSVSGDPVLGWKVVEEEGKKRLRIDLSRPIEDLGALTIRSQSPLGGFPAQVEPLRWTPVGTIRHSGHVRIANEGAVRLEVPGSEGMMQLSPDQFPGEAIDRRQVFVFRFPSAEHACRIAADRVLPEVSVSEVTVHEMGETDRLITSEIELDVREAPIRDWTLRIPADFAVAAVGGAAVADYSVASEAEDGSRSLKILFSGPVSGRQLVSLRLEKNEPAAAGEWALPVLRFPGARSSRGYLGVATAPGYRAVTASSEGLAETPVDYFPRKQARLQQAFRIREAEWSAAMQVEALGQSVQADVFHLYSLKEGVAYGSVVVNYFVVGAPSNEWRLRLPEGVGNVAVTGQGVGRDWRQEGETLIVPLVRAALGASTLLVTFEQPMGAQGGEIRPGQVRPLGVQSERGFVQVTSPLQMKTSVITSEGSVLKIDASELPTEYRLLSSAPTLQAWQYTASDVDLAMKVELYESAETAGEIIDFAALESHVSRDGQVATTARFFVRTKSTPSLEVSLPAGANLWEAEVAGERVNARQDGELTLVPLPAGADANEPVEVVLRYGQALGEGKIELAAPRIGTATAVTRWEITGDDGSRLVPTGGTAELVRPVRTETGFEWLAVRGRMAASLVLFLAALGLVLRRVKTVAVLGWISLAGAVAWSFGLAWKAWVERRANLGTLEFTAPAVLPGEGLTVGLKITDLFGAMVHGTGVVLAVLGVALLVWALLRAVGRDRFVGLCVTGGLALISYGLLAQHGGAVLFFAAFGLALLFGLLLPWTVGFFRGRGKVPVEAAAVLLLLAFMPRVEAADAVESMTHRWTLHETRLSGTIEVKIRADEAGERFLLLRPPAVLTGFEGEGLKVTKEQDGYYLVAGAAGVAAGVADFELAIANPRDGWTVPTGPAAAQRIEISTAGNGWEFHADPAARVENVVVEGATQARIDLLPGAEARVWVEPRQRDAAQEETRFYSELADLFVPGPGVVNGVLRVKIRPAQGRVKELRLQVSEGFMIGEVADGPVGRWRFNPESRELRVTMDPAQETPFEFTVSSQRAIGALPVDTQLAPLRVMDTAGEVGLLALAFGGEAQPENLKVAGMSEVNPDDFDASLLPGDGVVLQKVYRYGADEASLMLRVAPVAPEIRAVWAQTLSLGEDRIVLAADLLANITRAGVFKLAIELPESLEIEAVTGGALSHWTESRDGDRRLLTLHLNGKTLGEQKFSLSLTAPAPGDQDSWPVPRLTLLDAARQQGTMTVVPGRGLQVRAVSRTHASQLDPGEASVPQPGALAFRLLQDDWALGLAIKRLDAWVTAQVLHEVTLREGQSLTRATVVFKIENAAEKSLRVRVPGLDEAAASTVRASGPAVGDFVPVEGEDSLWEIRFQRGVAGETTVNIEFEQVTDAETREVAVIGLEEVRQTTYFVGVRTAGRLVADEPPPPRGWRKAEWAMVPGSLRADHRGELPEFVYRVAESEGPLSVPVAWHELAGAESLRVLDGRLATLISVEGSSITRVELSLDAKVESTLSLTLPDGAVPFSLLVNGEGVPLVRDGEAWKFYVAPSPLPDQPAVVRFAYGLESGAQGHLLAPSLSVPLTNLVWDVYVPEGWKLADSAGDFEPAGSGAVPDTGLEPYLAAMARRKKEGEALAVRELDQGIQWLNAGRQDRAGEVLGKAARNGFLDEASNEDARVQFRNLRMQQAVLGLNTRRQRMYLDNRSNGLDFGNAQIEQAAEENPILRGDANYDPREFDRLMVGNSAEETTSLKAIAGRIVDQQIQIDGAREALDVELLELGTRYRFTRSLQVEGGRPMALDLDLERDRRRGWWFGGIVGLLASGVCVVGVKRRP
ncbi:hypothetical protein [Haloferula sargassicola]|uniref:Uncharacterized protein n=1 Tax=Haloferula sargassicola TaxID=490096 RepID=A0ABP9UWN0_9BACT